MIKKHTNSKAHDGGKAIVAGILGVAAAAAAGAYFLYGTKDGKKRMKQIKGWALKAKGEVLEKVEALKEVNEERYHEVIDSVLKRYATLKSIDAADVAEISQELKGHWKNIKKELQSGVEKVSKMKSKSKKAKKSNK